MPRRGFEGPMRLVVMSESLVSKRFSQSSAFAVSLLLQSAIMKIAISPVGSAAVSISNIASRWIP